MVSHAPPLRGYALFGFNVRNVTRSGNIGDEFPSELGRAVERPYILSIFECLAARIPRLVVLDPAASPGLQCPRESRRQLIRNMLAECDLV